MIAAVTTKPTRNLSAADMARKSVAAATKSTRDKWGARAEIAARANGDCILWGGVANGGFEIVPMTVADIRAAIDRAKSSNEFRATLAAFGVSA